MPVEIEAKFAVQSHGAVRERLRSIGARYVGRVHENNVIFDTKDGTLFAADQGLRVRSATPDGDNAARSTLTFKGARRPGKMKMREEIEIAVEDGQRTQALLRALGFVESVVYEKKRETWQYNQCTVELDDLPELGLFVEIEGPDEAAIGRVQRTLGLADSAMIRDSYVALVIPNQSAPDGRSDRVSPG